MDRSIVDVVWKRDGGECQLCGRNLVKKIDPYIDAVRQFSKLDKIKIWQFEFRCFDCGKLTPIYTYKIKAGYEHMLGDVERLDKRMCEMFETVGMNIDEAWQRVWRGNKCSHCKKCIDNELLCRIVFEEEGKVVNELDNDLGLDELNLDQDELAAHEKRAFYGHIHHVDRNRENNRLRNLILLCRNCHVKTHVRIRKSIKHTCRNH